MLQISQKIMCLFSVFSIFLIFDLSFGQMCNFDGMGGGGGDVDNFGSSPNSPSGFGPSPSDSVVSRPPIIVPSLGPHSATLIFFHGMGDQGDGWAETFRNNFGPQLRNLKFVVPNAKEIGGMSAWFDYQGLDPTAPEDLEGLEAVKNYAHQLINCEIGNGIPASRIFLGGFSQGGPVALYSGLSFPEPLGGVISLSGFLLPRDTLPTPIRQIPGLNMANSALPIFIGHGLEDPNVPFPVARMTVNALRRFDPNVLVRTYPMGHSNCEAEFADVIQFIRSRAPPY